MDQRLIPSFRSVHEVFRPRLSTARAKIGFICLGFCEKELGYINSTNGAVGVVEAHAPHVRYSALITIPSKSSCSYVTAVLKADFRNLVEPITYSGINVRQRALNRQF